MYFDRSGKAITMYDWIELNKDPDYHTVAVYEDSEIVVSTVWLGLNHNFSKRGSPRIFETMVFSKKNNEINYSELDGTRYSTEEEAIKGHAKFLDLWLSPL